MDRALTYSVAVTAASAIVIRHITCPGAWCVSDYRGRGPCFLAVESDQSGPYRVGIGARPDRDLRRPVRIHEFFIRHCPTVSNKCSYC